MLTCYRLSGRKIRLHTTPPLGVDAHHSAIALWSACTFFSLLASSTMPPPPPQHKELFSLRQPDWIHEISHWGGEANPGPTWPTCQDSTRITEVAEWRRADTRGRRAKRAFPCCPSAFSPSQPFKWPRSIYYILIPLLGPGTHWGQDRDESPSQNTPSASGKLKKKKKKKVQINKRLANHIGQTSTGWEKHYPLKQGSHNRIPELTAPAAPAILLEMEILGPHPRPTDLDT